MTDDVRLQPGGGEPAARFTLAVDRAGRSRKADAPAGETSDFVPCVAFGRHAELLASKPRRGQAIFVAGRLTSRRVEGQGEGAKPRTYYSVVIEDLQFLGPPPSGRAAEPAPATATAAIPAPAEPPVIDF